MKTKLLYFLLLLSLTTVAQTNLVPNGSFETWTSSSQPDNWYRYISELVSQSSTAQNGNSSTNMQLTSGTLNFINTDFFAVEANKTYRVTLYHRAVLGTFSSLDLSVYHKPGTFKEEIAKKSDVTFSTSEWRKIEFEYTSTVSENIEIDVTVNGTLNSEILVDNVSVVDVAEVPGQYTKIPDPEFESYLGYLGYDKDGINGKVLTSAISTVKTFDLSYYQWNITDLTGIEGFTALENLTFRGNTGSLTSLNVSKNLMLKTLNCSSNKLTTLDVSNNLELESLICGSNKLTTLDVSKNLKLKTLNFDSNQITSISIGDNKQLVDFNCYNNKITSLDLSQNVLLTDLNCGVNQLTSIDISGNVLLKNLNCNNNKLTELNLSKNNKLEVVRTDNNSLAALDLSQQPNLKALDCYRNKINNLNISKNTLLTSLACYNNELIQLDISNNKELVAIDCLSNRLKNLDVTQNTKLVTLTAHYNDLTKIDVSNNLLLKNLTISYNELSGIDLTNNSKLEYFNGSNNPVKSLDLSKNIALTSVSLQETRIESLDLSFNTKLTSVNLASSKLLYDLNLKNGNNTALDINLLNALYLNCVLVDNKVYADTKWSTKKEIWTKFSEDCRPYTVIPDSNFEDKLIALKIDIDGKNGQVLTSSIATVKTLDVSNSNIVDLTGIQDFASLQTLNCKDNQLLYLDLSKNSALTSVNTSNNKLVSLDLKNGKNTLLNKSTSLFTNNTNLKCIQVDDQDYANTNWSGLKDATANYNTLCNAFVVIPDSNFENKLIDLGIDVDGKNGKVLTSNIAAITSLDVSSSTISNLTGIEGFVALKQLDFSSNNLKAVDLTKNVALTSLNATSNQLLNLDLSQNTALVQVDCSANNLFSLNLKNGKNTNLTAGNFKGNPNLTCIQVDDKSFSDTNWPNLKETTVSYALVCDDNSFTLIPDLVFENKLIKLGIDKDGVNGGVLTSSISSLKEVSLYIAQGSTEVPIKDLTGIQDFKALEKLSVSNNQLTELDLSGNVALTELSCGYNRLSKINLSKNILLTKVDCQNNYFTQIDFSKNTELLTVNCQENKLTSLDFSKNPKFNYLYAHTNKLTSLNLTANPSLNYLNCANSLLENLDLSNNKSIMYLFCEGNRFKTLDVSNQTSLSQFGCDNNLLTSINVSKNTYMSHFSCSGNQLTVLDLSGNANLWTLYCKENKLTTLNISKNKKLEHINCSSNNLVSLNIKNGNNVNFEGLDNDYSIDFRNNPNLTCIQVDDITFANEKMSGKKDATATYNTNCGSTLVLPNDNFTVETKGESCLGENNGEINITAQATYVYEAIISGKTYPFTNNSLKVANLAPGSYTVSVTIPDENFEQNFNFTIVKAATTTGKSSITSRKVDVEITEGTAPFTVFIDGTEQFQTSDSNFSLELKEGGLLEVATAKACEGIYSKKIKTADILGTVLSAYPNPTNGIFEIEVPTDKNEVVIELYSFGGQLVSGKKYVIENGTAKLTLENQPSGIYAAKIYLETPEYIKIIKK
ncbi:T9SS type A sorting domain-containing protein [Flavobacterium sp. LC2016-12]|uniref:T9SS type A sorting domain-containing protein n=1 Tax=Flavobacterium sp. LC2016-12 TaxID=2783794 RepID=UPI00188CAA74|nr:T9SS type A sorting domain-containing protein [Flavobacterium sp. LC2016-12]MBF4464656.1 T9SS type A sorting domain-containing protein [Flavobacterium sp. LC2016-12]